MLREVVDMAAQGTARPTPVAGTAVDEAGNCTRCGGEGTVLTEAWRRWWDAYADAEAAHRFEFPDGDWPTSAAFWDVDAETPAEPETVPCAGCWGTGRCDVGDPYTTVTARDRRTGVRS